MRIILAMLGSATLCGFVCSLIWLHQQSENVQSIIGLIVSFIFFTFLFSLPTDNSCSDA